MVALIHRSANTAYALRYRAVRADWAAWMGGQMGEPVWWSRVQFMDLTNAASGQPALARDFLAKDFGFAADAGVVGAPTVESRLVQEPWGGQLYPGRIRVPAGGQARAFAVLDQSPGSDWAVYAVSNPVQPLYRASADPGGGLLAALRLPGGDYLLAVSGPAPPAEIRLQYLLYVIAPAGDAP
jgi:hypothetical protein